MPFLAALIPALVGGAAAVGGALIGKSSADKAQKAQNATNAKVDAYGAPYRAAGVDALGDVGTAYGLGDPSTLAARRAALSAGFESSPLYQYTYRPAVDEATQAAERNASASGLLNSGRTIKAIQDRAARIGGQTFGNYLSGLEGTAARGQNAAFQQGGLAMAGTAASNQAGMAGGDALAAGVLGAGKAVQSGITNYNYLKGVSSYGPSGTSAFNSGYPIY